MNAADPCAMPVGYGATCQLPGDHPHGDGCQPDDPGSRRHLCLHSVAPHKLCNLRRDHKGPHLPLPKIPESGAA